MIRRKGFTLIEVLAASVVIALIAVGMIAVFESGTYLLMEARQRMESALVAQSKFEELLNKAKSISGYNSIRRGTIVVPDYYKLRKWLKSANYSSTNYPNYKLIRIRISWSFRNKDYNQDFYTLIYNPNNFTK